MNVGRNENPTTVPLKFRIPFDERESRLGVLNANDFMIGGLDEGLNAYLRMCEVETIWWNSKYFNEPLPSSTVVFKRLREDGSFGEYNVDLNNDGQMATLVRSSHMLQALIDSKEFERAGNFLAFLSSNPKT